MRIDRTVMMMSMPLIVVVMIVVVVVVTMFVLSHTQIPNPFVLIIRKMTVKASNIFMKRTCRTTLAYRSNCRRRGARRSG